MPSDLIAAAGSGSAAVALGRRDSALRLHGELATLRSAVAEEASLTFDRWRTRISRAEYLPSAENLALYMALRRRDLRELQVALMPLGLSSLGRCEARVLPNLDAVLAALGAIAGSGDEGEARFDPNAFFNGHRLLGQETGAVFGPAPRDRGVRIMVTLSTEAAREPTAVRDLIAAGMDVARVNCAHDDAGTWAAMAANVRRAEQELGRRCRLCFDLPGPRARVLSTTVPYDGRVRRGEQILMAARPVPVPAEQRHQFQCSLPEALEVLDAGARVLVNDGRLGAVVKERVGEGLVLRVDAARDKGEHLRLEKGLNFPGTQLDVAPLGERDLKALDTVAGLADMVGLSFVQRAEDVDDAQRALAERGASGVPLVLKVETAQAIRNLPELIVQGAGHQPLAVMIARGDLAVEVGHRRVAEMQEELLWLCEAAHVPVIWATQVLDTLVKKGVRHRGEMTDAAMAERAECVMLNKGPFALEGVRLLAELLGRMEGHQSKKASRMRALQTWMGEA